MGAESPCGHLTATWPRGYNDLKAAQRFPSTVTSSIAEPTSGGTNVTKPTVFEYDERNHIGYGDLLPSGTLSSFSSGYRLHYTYFSLEDLSIALVEDMVNLHIFVANVGNVSGRDVVESYVINFTSDNLKYRELRGYGKTRKLELGESQVLLIRIPFRKLRVFDVDCGWYLPNGTCTVISAKSVEEISIKRQLSINSGSSCKNK